MIHACFHPFKYSEAQLQMPITKQTQHLKERSNQKFIPIEIAVQANLLSNLKKLSKFYDLVVWTSAISEYAHCILDFLKIKPLLKQIYTQQDCVK